MSYRIKLSGYFRSRDRGWILSLLAAVFLLYLPFLGSPFFFDDLTFFFGGAAEKYTRSGFHFDLRWLPYATLGWTEMMFSNVVTHFFHLGNMLLHAANVIVLFYLLRLISGAIGAENGDSTAIIRGAWFGALIFAVHPVAVYAAGYVVQRSILMATLFALLMQLAYVRGLLSGQVRWLALAAAAYFFAVFSKEHSVMTPLLLAAQTFLLRSRVRVNARALWLAWAAFLLIGLLIVLRAKGVFGAPYEAMAASLFEQQGIAEGGAMLHLLSAFTQAGLFFKYLWLWLIPNPAWMALDMREPFVHSFAEWRGWLGALGFLAYGATGFWLLLRPRWAGVAGLALLYPWLQFMLEFSSIRVQEPFVLYRSYLWMPGLMLFFPLLLSKWPERRTMITLGLVALLLTPLAANRLWVFADGYRLWNDAALLLPDDQVAGADRILFNRGQASAARNRWDAAIADFERAAAISPQYAPVRFELGWAYGVKGRYQDAMVQFDAAIADDPNFANAYYGKAMLLKMRGEHKQAADLMVKSCELKHAMACLITKGHIEH